MDWTHATLFALLAVAILAIGILLRRSRDRAPDQVKGEVHSPVSTAQEDQTPTAAPEPEPLANAIGFGISALEPAVTLRPFTDVAAFAAAKPLPKQPAKVISKLSAMAQAAPGVIVAAQGAPATGGTLMEVVINGDLVRASDCVGFRAFSMGPSGIDQHAKLMEAPNLSNLVNAAAVWQVASVLVAQKHLADISEKLRAIERGINDISQFLDNQRRARMVGAKEYLEQIYMALEYGDFPQRTIQELESTERDMLEIQNHLLVEFADVVAYKVDIDTFGTEKQTEEAQEKLVALDSIVGDLDLCLKIRTAAWYVSSVVPGDAALQNSRKASIDAAYQQFEALAAECERVSEREAAQLDSFWNSKKTLAQRKQSLRSEGRAIASSTLLWHKIAQDDLAAMTNALTASAAPTSLLLEVDSGQVISIRTAA
jgi:hypothetical protein